MAVVDVTGATSCGRWVSRAFSLPLTAEEDVAAVRGLVVRCIGAALRAMHANVAHRWTLQELAGISRMSRSAFAASFKIRIGSAPLDYLIQWRMGLARDALRRGTHSISELTRATGYESESAFSTAFSRVVGTSPTQFRNRPMSR